MIEIGVAVSLRSIVKNLEISSLGLYLSFLGAGGRSGVRMLAVCAVEAQAGFPRLACWHAAEHPADEDLALTLCEI